MTRLTPFDDELCVMVRSLTGKDAQVTEHKEFYTIVVNMPNKSEAERKAIDDAVCGRIGLRLTFANYNNFSDGVVEYGIMYYSEYEKLPSEYRGDMHDPGYMEVGKMYCRKLKEVFAIQIMRANAADVVEFCGGGIVETPRIPNGITKFTFATPNGVFLTGYETDFIITDGNNFEIVKASDFARDYEPKDGGIVEMLNERFGTDIYMRCKKLDEEVSELFQVVRSSGAKVLSELAYNIDFIDELADVAVVLNHIAGIAGFTNAELEKIAIDKIKGREKEPDFARRHPHKERPDIRRDIAQKAMRVRELQKIYFRNRSQEILIKSKEAEKELDELLEIYSTPTL